MTRTAMREGAFYVDGERRLLWSAEYPYYRDDARNWRARLEAAKDAGIPYVTCYVPWRHHAPEDPLAGRGGYDFDGKTQENRDVRGFLRLCDELGLRVIAKPGPFVHAELPFGGLPDYVAPDRNPEIEAELHADGSPCRWSVEQEAGGEGRPLPAPLGDRFLEYVRDWLTAVSRDVLKPFCAAHGGPIVAVQLLNEGIYSDSATGIITELGYAPSTMRHWREFLERGYGSIEAYNEAHATRHRAWDDVAPPRELAPASEPRGMLAYLDRSRWYHALYEKVLEEYGACLREAGVPRDVPVLLNFNPNTRAYRTHPGSNDGWYSKVARHVHAGIEWGYTDWIGLVSHHPKAYLQYVLAGTRHRGVNLEENWGFSEYYDPYYRYTQPSYFQSLLALATGATGLNVYTLAGTAAWQRDANLNAGQDTRLEYPQSAPLDAEGRPRSKWWTVRQLSDYFAAEGGSLAGEPRADVAWAAYVPYAWAGAWCPLGAPGERVWTASGFRAAPRLTYHGLETFIEWIVEEGGDVAQANLLEADDRELARWKMLVVAGYDFMDAASQARLSRWVQAGGTLLLSGMLPRLDARLAPSDDHPLREAFPHGEERLARLDPGDVVDVDLEGEPIGGAVEWLVRVDPPEDAIAVARARGEPVGYARPHGHGKAVFLGWLPWYAALAGDDLRLVQANRGLVRAVAERFSDAKLAYARAVDAPGVDVWQYGGYGTKHEEHLVVVNRALTPYAPTIEYCDRDGTPRSVRLALVPQTVCLLAMDGGAARSFLLKCVNDSAFVSVPPFLETEGGSWTASAPCDLCVARVDGRTVRVSVANAPEEGVVVTTPFGPEDVERAVDGRGRPLERAGRGRLSYRLHDLARAGAAELTLHRGDGASG